jgi:uncharacterized delta-60 repeat protein
MTLPLIAVCLVLADCSGSTSTSTGPTTAFAVMRFVTTGPTAGSLDTTFAGGRGVALTGIDPGLFAFALAAAVQPFDNNILAGGSSGLAGQGVIALVRYDQSGALDPSFGSGGIVRTTLTGVAATASAIAVQSDHKILVAALTFTASSSTTGIALLRYNADGTLDKAGFGAPNGFVTATIGSGLAGDTCALALQGDGKIVVAGASQSGDIVLYRYDGTGALDTLNFGNTGTTPGTGGKSIKNIGAAATSPAVALQSTGKIVVVTGTSDNVVLRFNTNGTLDTTFGATQTVPGIVVTDVGGVDFANAVAVQSDDSIVVAGHANVNFSTDASDISLVRYTVDGTLDTTFGTANSGIVTTDLNGKFDNAFSVALETPAATSTNILVSGNTGSGGFSQAVVLRYDSTGALDTMFNSTGFSIAPPVGPSTIASGNAVVLQSTLGIIVAGYD